GQLSRLGPLATRLAHAGAVLGDGAPLRQAARLAEADLDDAAAAADQLLAGGILARVDPLAFAHPIVRASLHDELAPATRARMHAAAARLLSDERADSERVAAHLMRALPAGDADAVELLQAAAAQARARAVPESAVRYLRRALEEPPAQRQRGALLAQLGRAESAAGLPEATETLTQALALAPTPVARADTLLWIGRARFAAGALKEAAAAFDRGLAELGADTMTGGRPARRATDLLPAGDDRGAGRGGDETNAHADGDAAARAALHELTVELRAGFISAARFETSLRPEAQRRLAPLLATPADGTTRGERALLAEVALEQGIRSAPPAEAVATAMRAWAGGRILDELDAQGIVLSQIAATLTWSDAFAESQLVLDEAVAHAERNGATQQLATASYLRAWPQYYCGDLAAAERDAARALATPGWKMYEPAARAVVALVALERGDLATAERMLDVPDAAERWAGSIPYAMLLEAEGRMLLLRGDAAGALRAFEGCGALISAMDTTHPFTPWRSQVALAQLRAGARARAAALAAEEAELARALSLARPLGAALRVAGLAADSGERRIELLRESADVLARSPARLERLRSLVALGAELRLAGEFEQARPPLREALALAEALGATVLEEQARAELVAAGGRPRRAATSGAAALTPSELRIARLAALGNSNREIAEQLVVVSKTVQFHLSNAYRKLGVSGRDQLAAALAQQRDDDAPAAEPPSQAR
ncbi:LuxR C-terminal-related transcriptional regulator, partial [Conexibacter stalactiti]